MRAWLKERSARAMAWLVTHAPMLAFFVAVVMRWAVGAWRYAMWTLDGRPVTYAVGKEEFEDRERIPIKSDKADAKRAALAYARQRTGNPNLQWGKARQLMKQWLREEREASARKGGRVTISPEKDDIHPITPGVIPEQVVERRRGKVAL